MQPDPYYQCPHCHAIAPAAWWARPAGPMRPPVEVGCSLCRKDHTAATMVELLPLDMSTPCTSCGGEVAYPAGAVRARCTSSRCGATFDPHDRPRRAPVTTAARLVVPPPARPMCGVFCSAASVPMIRSVSKPVPLVDRSPETPALAQGLPPIRLRTSSHEIPTR